MRKKMFIRIFHLGFIKQDFLPWSHQVDPFLVVYIEEKSFWFFFNIDIVSIWFTWKCFWVLSTDQPEVSRQSSQITLLLRKAGIPLFAWCPTILNVCHAISHSKIFLKCVLWMFPHQTRYQLSSKVYRAKTIAKYHHIKSFI